MKKCKAKVSLQTDDVMTNFVAECELNEGHGGDHRCSIKKKRVRIVWENDNENLDEYLR